MDRNRVVRRLAAYSSCGVLLLLLLGPRVAWGVPYGVGWRWDRSADWTPGTTLGSSAGNPDDDLAGNPVWRYEWTTGGALGSADPWYDNAGTLMVWDNNWFGGGYGLWARGNDVNPPIGRTELTHTVSSTSNWQAIPLVRWMNPAGAVQVDITGTLTEIWAGPGGLGQPVDVDVVLAYYDASNGTTSLLVAQTVSKPTAAPTVGDAVAIPVDVRALALGAGDQLIITHRARSVVSGWQRLVDDLTITVVPEPAHLAAASVLLLLAAGGRRRARRGAATPS